MPPMNGRKVVVVMLVGAVIGWSIGLFLGTIVRNTPTDITPNDLMLLRRLLAAAGALCGLAIESMRQLQAANPDPAYRQRRRLK